MTLEKNPNTVRNNKHFCTSCFYGALFYLAFLMFAVLHTIDAIKRLEKKVPAKNQAERKRTSEAEGCCEVL